MKKGKALYETVLRTYLGISLGCLILCCVPTVQNPQVLRAWIFCTEVFCAGMWGLMCRLLMRLFRLGNRRGWQGAVGRCTDSNRNGGKRT